MAGFEESRFLEAAQEIDSIKLEEYEFFTESVCESVECKIYRKYDPVRPATIVMSMVLADADVYQVTLAYLLMLHIVMLCGVLGDLVYCASVNGFFTHQGLGLDEARPWKFGSGIPKLPFCKPNSRLWPHLRVWKQWCLTKMNGLYSIRDSLSGTAWIRMTHQISGLKTGIPSRTNSVCAIHNST